MTHRLGSSENFDIVRGNQTIRVPFAAQDPSSAETDTLATLASPAFTGTPTAPTPTSGDDSTKIATTAFVKAAVDAGGGGGGGGVSGPLMTLVMEHYSNNTNSQDVTVNGHGTYGHEMLGKPICLSGVTSVSISYGGYSGDCGVYIDGTMVNSDVSPTLPDHDFSLYIRFADCLAPDTPILMADGGVKRVADLVAGDAVASVDPETGELSSDRVAKVSQGVGKFRDIWTFEDGRTVTTVGRHRFWNADLGEFMYMEAWNIGESARNSDGKRVNLVNHIHELGEFPHATLFTEKWNNYFAGGLLAGNRRSTRGRM